MSNFAREPSTMIPKQPDCRSGELVSRLLAATPPYLYNIPLAPQSFFFSEMLRGFVHARSLSTAKENNNIIGPPPPHPRRGRKRSWKESATPSKSAEPLELTTVNKSPPPLPPPPPKLPSPNILAPPPPLPTPANLMSLPTPGSQDISSLQPRLQSDLIMPPLWFPPLYPPMPPQFDPLNFLIDLRVSGNLWDGKVAPEVVKDDTADEPLNLQMDEKKAETNFGFQFLKQRHCSAFRVPTPRQSFNEQFSSSEKSKSTNYILQNLQSIYTDIKKGTEKTDNENKNGCDNNSETQEIEKVTKGTLSSEEESQESKEKKCKDLRALIGLELVVDYVKKDDRPGAKKVTEKNYSEKEGEGGPESSERDLSLSDSTDETFSNHSSTSLTDNPTPLGQSY